ncbi:MAG: hypothetical protein ABW321_12065 [Polyangiales bacterium]
MPKPHQSRERQHTPFATPRVVADARSAAGQLRRLGASGACIAGVLMSAAAACGGDAMQAGDGAAGIPALGGSAASSAAVGGGAGGTSSSGGAAGPSPVSAGGADAAAVGVGAGAGAGSGGQAAATAGGSGVSGGASTAGSSGAADGGGAGAAANSGSPVLPQLRDGRYVFALGATTLEIDPVLGGRVTQLALDGVNVLTGPDVDSLNWGSTFWPSPQARWQWPPVPEIDSEPYTPTVEADTLTLQSQRGMRADVRVTKRFRALPSDGAFEVAYVLENSASSEASWAPWQISRVGPGGLTFFPTGESSASTQLPLMEALGISWYRHDPAAIAEPGQKWSGDGKEGWIAHVAEKTLFVKRFMDLTPAQQAPAPEGELAIYASPRYVEIEPQGPYAVLPPQGKVEWSVRWYLRAVPDDVSIEIGSASLVQLVRDLTGP